MERSTKRKICDKCHTKIIEGECECGVWFDTIAEGPLIGHYIEYIFSYLNSFPPTDHFSGDHHTGWCFVFFKGDYNTVQEVKKFLKKMKRKK